ncbi:protein phosphatase 1 regulatory subunit 15A [Varanus komodoensis]|uniref:protein phosphatase 1 regulatory subunit 15A n=1 Tax=Varanus komodoensis TaxID=61221 RepID=UPI001CF78A2E|nr:protein phosphatase 1 regulatory subunit 15A [Varanus komodoensis]
MPPSVMSIPWTSHPQNTNTSFGCCYPFGLRMAKILPPELSPPRPPGKFSITAMLLRRATMLAMDWLKKYLHFMQNFPARLMGAILRGIASRAMSILEKAARLLREREEMGRAGGKMEKQNLEGSHLQYLVQGHFESFTLESLVQDGYLGKGLNQLSIGSSSSKVDMMHLEKEGISELCLRSPSIGFEFRNDWEDFSEDDDEDSVGLEDMESSGDFSQGCWEDFYHPQIFPKGDSFGNGLNEYCSNIEELNTSEGALWQSMECTFVSLEYEGGLKASRDLSVHEDQSLEDTLDSSEDGEQLEMNRNHRDKGAVNSGSPNSFKSPLILSLFYSPSEEEENEEDDSEDWWSEDEIEDSDQFRTALDSSNSGNGDKDLERDSNSLEDFCGSFFTKDDPFHPLCFSKPIQAPKPKYDAPKQSWPLEDPRANHSCPAHKCSQPSSAENGKPVSAETVGSQEENPVIKKVRFSPVITVHHLPVWDNASQAARKGPWEEMARDRCRFRRRIAEVGAILEPCLDREHQARMWRKIHGLPLAPEEEDGTINTPFLSRSSHA